MCPASCTAVYPAAYGARLKTKQTGPVSASLKPSNATPPVGSIQPLFSPKMTRTPLPTSAASPASSDPGGSSVVTSTSHPAKASDTKRQIATIARSSVLENAGSASSV